MAKALVITEKPSVARDIADALGGFREEEGYFESDDLVVTFAVGHLYELLAPEELDDKYKRWTLDVLPILPEQFGYKVKKGQTDRIRTIQRLIRRSDIDSIVNACDAGREGELIFREIVENLGATQPIRRLWLQSMTDDAIRTGFRRLRRGEELQGLADAAACRAQSDWLIGMNATRALTKRLKSRKEKTSWSAGRVQTPTLAMLVDKEFEVLAHVPKPFWRVTATFEHEGNRYEGSWFDPAFDAGDDPDRKDDRIFDAARAAAIAAALSARNVTALAGETRKPSRESAPPLFDLTSLQREANRRFSWSARRTLSAAQRCYERHKVLTYPRTSSKCLPEDYRETVAATLASFAETKRRDEGFADLSAAAARLRESGLENEDKIFNDAGVSDHFAIVPTGSLPREALSGDDKRLFDLVARRFFGAFHPPAQWERVERTTVSAGESFRTRARTLVVPGWRSVLADTSDGEEETALPALVAGAEEASDVAVRALEAKSEAEETKPPARITEARLLSLMENAGQQIDDEEYSAALHEKGIGTPATRADIIENLIGKGYVVRLGKALRPTVKGIRMIDTLRRIHIDRLTSPELTGEIEYHLLQVERGGRTRSDFMGEIADYTVAVVDRAKSFGYDELYDADETFGNCPNCGRPVIEMAWFYRCREEPARDPDCPLRFWKDISGRYLDKRTVRALIANGTSGEIDGFTARNGRTYRGVITLNTDEWKLDVKSAGWNDEASTDTPEYEVDPEPLGRCPFEEDCSIVESPTLFICERALKEAELTREERKKRKEEGVPQSCGFVFPRTVCKREITREEADHYLRTGKTELLTDFTSRFGRPFSATLVLKDTGRHGFEFPPRKRAGEDEGGEAPSADAAASAAPAPKRTRTKKAAATAGEKPAAAAKAPRKKAPRKKKTSAKKSAAAEE
jgi:DNA topoisomerase III